MKILSFESIESTSTHAADLVAGGLELPPFVVIAKTQTQGRGRTGKPWSSPQGGIYLTLVLDSRDLDAIRMRQLPLLVATASADWIWKRFARRVTIKWPNDLLYGTAKLGGILCESSVQGHDWGPVLIGIGINLHAAPQVADQKTISLEDIVGRSLGVEAEIRATDLAQTLVNDLLHKDLLSLYASYALEPGQLWIESGTRKLGSLEGLDADGQLRIKGLGEDTLHALSSVRHDWKWIYQDERDHPLLVADVGNSLCKLAVYRHPTQEDEAPETYRFNLMSHDPNELYAVHRLLQTLQLPRGWPIHAISVQDHVRDRLESLLRSWGLRLVMVPKRPLAISYELYRYEELGIDRAAMAEAAVALFPERNLLVVSAGTAVTIEVITADHRYQGGYILPGLQTKLTSLHLRTARLPQIRLAEINPLEIVEAEFLGHDTRSAMLRGVLRETELAVRGLEGALEKRLGVKGWHLICTGGDGEFLSKLLDAPFHPSLILEGVRLLVLGGRALVPCR